MGNDKNESPEKLWFTSRIRQLRVDANKKQREVAKILGVKTSSYANAESCNFKRMSRDRVLKLAKAYNLSAADTDELLAGWEALPVSDYDKRRDAQHQRVRTTRAKAKAYDPLKLALLEITTLYIVARAVDPASVCACAEVDMFADESDSGQPKQDQSVA